MKELWNIVGETKPSALWNLVLEPVQQPLVHLPCSVNFSPNLVHWSFQDMPVKDADKHFFICGTTGSGKTTQIRLFLQSIAPRLLAGANEQIVIFDAKGDILPILSGLGFDVEGGNVHVLNPFDVRSCVWNLAESMQSPALARYLGALLVPAEKRSSAPFFWQAAREIVCAVAMGLSQVAGKNWTFRDLICAFDKKEFVLQVCRQHARSDLRAKMFFEDEKHVLGVLSEIITKIAQFDTVAALWHSNPNGRVFSIPEFLSNPGILVLGHDDIYKESIWPLNALVMRALTNEILRRDNHSCPRHWFLFDEFPAMEKADFIHDLLNRGRSKGASVLLGAQSIEGLHKIYEENGAEELLSNCANKTFLRAGGPKTANWMERYFGHTRYTATSWSTAQGKDGATHTVNHGTQDRPQFNSSFFSSLPFPERGGRMALVGDGPGTGAVVASRPFDRVLSWLKPLGDAPGVLLRNDAKSQTLEPWDEQRAEYFCGPKEQKPSSPPKRRRNKP